MTDQTQRVFTATVEAPYAQDLREKRDLSDAEIRAAHVQPISDERLAKHRARRSVSRRCQTQQAINHAIAQVILCATEATETEFDSDDVPGAQVYMPTTDLDGATITVSVKDLVVTATLTLPQDPNGPFAPEIIEAFRIVYGPANNRVPVGFEQARAVLEREGYVRDNSWIGPSDTFQALRAIGFPEETS